MSTQQESNTLFPIFLKLEEMSVLIIGGSNVALEKLNAVLQNSPRTKIRLVSITINEEIKIIAKNNQNIELIQSSYNPEHLEGINIIIAAVNNISTSEHIRKDAKQYNLLMNVADKPELCNFYLSSIVKKGNLKIAISTNGKSPTIAKRLKETFAELLPDQLDEVLNNMQQIRDKLKGNFSEKVTRLNEVTRILVTSELPK
ncbi:MAG: bifunctional precorrin-2 dehydrogenase/sirohydrochlorin ferrochelatase [Parafilimonas sp.]